MAQAVDRFNFQAVVRISGCITSDGTVSRWPCWQHGE